MGIVSNKNKKILAQIFLALFFSAPFVVVAQVDSSLVGEQRKKLEAELAAYEEQINVYQDLIENKREEGESLKRDISILNAKAEKARLAIRARDLVIDGILAEISEKTNNISYFEAEMEVARESLTEFLQVIRDYDELSPVELAIIHGDLSTFFDSLNAFDRVQESIHLSLTQFQDLRTLEQNAKIALGLQKSEELSLRRLQELQKKSLEKDETAKENILKITKGEEAVYKEVLDDKKERAAEIRSQLFLLTGSPDIPFEKALDLANRAYERTGVRPAFLLAIVTQETELGRNIGQCNLPDDPPKYKWKSIMNPSRDHKPYLDITSRLGLDPNLMPLSCPQAGGWGGAMGPAQFIPSTWVLFESRVTKYTGHNPPNPWDPEDAFMASASYLSDLGADKRTWNSEWEAAMRYFSGSTWKRKPWLHFYGDNVMSIADNYQDQINLLQSLAIR